MGSSAEKQKWLRRLRRLNEVVLDLEANSDCFSEFGLSARKWNTRTLEDVVTRVWFHWYAVLLRAVCRKGPNRHAAHNVSVEGLAAVGRQLETHHGRGFGKKNLRRMVQFATVFPDAEIVAALRRRLSGDPA
jgi:hypothetical protein